MYVPPASCIVQCVHYSMNCKVVVIVLSEDERIKSLHLGDSNCNLMLKRSTELCELARS